MLMFSLDVQLACAGFFISLFGLLVILFAVGAKQRASAPQSRALPLPLNRSGTLISR
jgi:cbb3-type cytochrome oxidase subunit 3